jgi:hypothetical protein
MGYRGLLLGEVTLPRGLDDPAFKLAGGRGLAESIAARRGQTPAGDLQKRPWADCTAPLQPRNKAAHAVRGKSDSLAAATTDLL